jgi:hypothetical protein
LKEILKEKRSGKITKGVLFSHDSTPTLQAFATQKKLVYLGFQCLHHQSYSPFLAPTGYHMFPVLKNQLERRHYSSDAEVIAAAETCLEGQYSENLLTVCSS